jgi:hypothetical protein
MTRFAQRIIAAAATVVLVTSLAACADATPAAACSQGTLFAAARQRVERAVSELDTTTSLELQESVVAMSDLVAVMREVSPRSLREPLGVLLAAYGQLVVSLDAVGFDTVAATTNASVANARIAFTDQSVVAALTAVENFLIDQCELARSATNPDFALTGTTLPLPEISEEPNRDVIEDGSDVALELQALGFTIGDSYGVVLEAPQAQCIGQQMFLLFGTTGELDDVDIDDDEYLGIVRQTFTDCGVTSLTTTTASQ